MNSLLGHIKWLFRSPRTRRLDEMAMAIADRYGMRKEYLAARKFGFSPLEALEDWDMVTEEDRKAFYENGIETVSKNDGNLQFENASLIVSILALAVSIFTIVATIHTNNKTNVLTEKVNSKEYQMSEDMKYDLIELVATLKSIVSKVTFYQFTSVDVEFSSELKTVRDIQKRPGYIVFLNTIDKTSNRIAIEEGALLLTNYYLVNDNVDVKDIKINALNLLHAIENSAYTLSNKNLTVKELCSMESFYSDYQYSEKFIKEHITGYQEFLKSLLLDSINDPDLEYYYYTFYEPNLELSNRAIDSGASLVIDYTLSNDLTFWKRWLWNCIEQKYHNEYNEFINGLGEE